MNEVFELLHHDGPRVIVAAPSWVDVNALRAIVNDHRLCEIVIVDGPNWDSSDDDTHLVFRCLLKPHHRPDDLLYELGFQWRTNYGPEAVTT